jgi:hypothetical protein
LSTNTTHQAKGKKVTPTEQNTKTPRTATGLFALLGALLRLKGSGAPRTSPRLVLPVLATTLGALVFSAAPALAAPPETPETKPATAITATTATLNGLLNPTAPGTPGSYQFSYAQSATECTPGTVAPESPELAMGTEKEAKSLTVTNLEPNRQYAFCIVSYSLFGVTEPAFGSAVPFKTLTAKPAVDAESTSAVSSTAATLEAQLNPNNQESTYLFEYSTKEKTGVLEGTIVKVPGSGPLEGFGDETASVPTGTLLPGTTYFYRVLATNATGTTDGTVSATGFTTPPTPKTEAATAITATTATFHGKLKPLNEKVATEYAFDYNTGEEATCNGESRTEPVSAGTGKGTEATATTAVTALQPNQKYTVCLVSINESGSEIDTTPVHFNTPTAAPTIEVSSEKASNVTPYEATLEAQVNPDNEPTTYAFEYSSTEAGGKLTGTITKVAGESPLEGGGEQTASVATGHVLTPGTTYHFRITATNGSGPIEGAGEFATPTATAPVIEGESSSGVTAELATLETTVNPVAQETTCSFEYGTEPALSSGVTTVACNNPNPLGAGDSGVTGSVSLMGLIPSTTYYYRAVATNATGTSTDPTIEHFETGPGAAPVIANEAASYVEQTAATLEGEITPEHLATSYQFEYLTEARYNENNKAFTGAHTLPGTKPIGAEEPTQKVTTKITGLTAATTYEYRLTATNNCHAGAPCVTDGPTKTLATSTSGGPATGSCPNEARRNEQSAGLALPDCRAYELVSPENTNGEEAVTTEHQGQPRAAASGAAIAYESLGVFGESGVGSAFYTQYVSRRGAEGWSTENVSPLQYPKANIGLKGPDLADAFTPELTEGILSSSASLTDEAPVEENDEVRIHLYRERFGSDSYQYVGGNARTDNSNTTHPVGESTNLEDVVYETLGEGGVEWLDGRKVPVTIANNGEGTGAVGGGSQTWHAVSEDGSRIIFTAGDTIYQRINTGVKVEPEPEREQSKLNAKEECTEPAKACTIAVSASQRTEPDPHGPQPAQYWTASTNGSKIFFTSNEELTNDAYTGPEDNAANLYEYEAAEPGKPGHLTDLSVDDSGAGAAVQGVVQSSEDADYVYFIADGVLPTSAVAGQPAPIAGQPNLYLSENGETRFIATLGEGETLGGPVTTAADVSPLGSTFAFVSARSLTGYDNDDYAEVYLYEASTGALACASCNPSGARPVGNANLSEFFGSQDRDSSELLYRTRNLAGDRLFFNSSDALAGAAGGVENVFEFEGGHIYPISDVAGSLASTFLDADGNGDDVFFASPNRLLPQAENGTEAVYDARVDGGFPLPAVPAPCKSSDTCEPGATPPPVAGPPSSEAYDGPGNLAPPPPPTVVKPKAEKKAQKLAKALKACHKDKKKKKRQACEKSAHRAYGAKASAKKSSTAKTPSRITYNRRAAR